MTEAAAVDRALEFLSGDQLESGRFRIEQTRIEQRGLRRGEHVVRPDMSIFCSHTVAHSLSHCDNRRVRPMIDRSLRFLESQKDWGGLWRFWSRDAPLHYQVSPDVDDTACISELLRRLGKGAPDNKELLLANRDPHGRFYTWMTPRLTSSATARWWWIMIRDITYGRLVTAWRTGARRNDVDTVVNANVVFYLGATPETEPVIQWLLGIAAAGLEASTDKWYRSSPAFYYAVSRCYAAGISGLGEARQSQQRSFAALAHPDGRIGENPLQTAFAVCAMMNFGFSSESYRASLQYLLGSQQSDGGWESCPLYVDGRPTPAITWGSRAATTALCVEALARAATDSRASGS